MKHNKLLTIREVAEELGITEQEVIDLAEEGRILAYRIGGVYLRFKPENIQEAKKTLPRLPREKVKISWSERIVDFFYFNDFYILASLIIVLMLIVIFRVS